MAAGAFVVMLVVSRGGFVGFVSTFSPLPRLFLFSKLFFKVFQGHRGLLIRGRVSDPKHKLSADEVYLRATRFCVIAGGETFLQTIIPSRHGRGAEGAEGESKDPSDQC